MEHPPTARATQQFLLLQQFLTGILAMHIEPEPPLAAPLPVPAPAPPPPPPPQPLPPPPPPLMVRRPRLKAKAKAKAHAKAPARRPTTTGRDEFPGDDSMDGGGGGAAGGGGGVGGGAAGPGGRITPAHDLHPTLESESAQTLNNIQVDLRDDIHGTSIPGYHW